MKQLASIFKLNRQWAADKSKVDPDYFVRLAKEQRPSYLWIGCSDSRVPANEITGVDAGEMFVHRNIANMVVHTDMNCLCVIQYAVEVLKIPHIIICGHYGCGGIRSALEKKSMGLLDNWLRNIKDIYNLNREQIDAIPEEEKRIDLVCELNVHYQVFNLCHTNFVQQAWQREQPLSVHGWIYRMEDGILQDMDLCISGKHQIEDIYHMDLHHS
ncbi:MAG: carbonate dehydratase [SAR324 cluster bacterium]|nr:carbonate dehydratase [SAR324 cluster bacterium]